MPDREWVQSERIAEIPGIRKKDHKLRLDSWIQIRSTGWDVMDERSMDDRPLALENRLFPIFHADRVFYCSF